MPPQAGNVKGGRRRPPVDLFAAVENMARVLLASLAVASATLELTTDNFDKEVFQSGKAAFVKFLAPW